MPTVFAAHGSVAPAAPWRRGRAGWLLIGLLLDAAVAGLVRAGVGQFRAPESGMWPAPVLLCAAVALAVLVCWTHLSVLPAASGHRAVSPARVALELPVAGLAVAGAFAVGFYAGFVAFFLVSLVGPALDGLLPDGVSTALFMLAVMVVPIGLGGMLAGAAMGALTGGVRRRRLGILACGWAAVALSAFAWLPSPDQLRVPDAVMAGVVLVAVLPWLLVTLPPRPAADHTSTGVSTSPASPNARR